MPAPNTLRLVLMLHLGILMKMFCPPALNAPNREFIEKFPDMESAERNLKRVQFTAKIGIKQQKNRAFSSILLFHAWRSIKNESSVALI